MTSKYTHTLQYFDGDPASLIRAICATSYSLATSDLPILILRAEDGAEGYQEHDYAWENVPKGYINQLNPERPGKYWRLEYWTCSGINHVVIYKQRGNNGLDAYTATWEVRSSHPPRESSAIKDARENGWYYTGSTVELEVEP